MRKITFIILLSTTLSLFATQKNDKEFIISGYLNYNWITEQTDLDFINYIDRICYFGMSPDENGEFTVDNKYIEKFKLVHSKMNKSQKIHLVIGGGGKVANMHVMGNNAEKRKKYILKLAEFLDKYQFDGIDIDWETDWDTRERVPVEHLVALIKGIKKECPSGLKITIALGRNDREHIATVQNMVEDASIMIYSTLNKEGLHSPLYTVKEIMQHFDKINIPHDKLLVGVPFYGKHKNGKTLVYRSICPRINKNDSEAHIIDGYSFNSIDIMKEKVKYLKENGYRGIMIWELTQDVPYSNRMSLLRAIYGEVHK